MNSPLKAACHCGAVTMVVPHLPEEINECQCSICRRYAAAWGWWSTDEVKFELREDAKLSQYVWGNREISFNFCSKCGCVCYWWPFEEQKSDGSAAKFGLNTRNMDPVQLLYVNRRIENACLFHPVKDKTAAHGDDRASY